ncbi:hypothetical protein [Spiroplasma eriocheiris]|uniref:Transmembrane protein n=1 Tax=Spiroplasma eriocheiris TaxID=315358 RepID=A0A0H3XLY4_9MOLU|nr:hypothetical protein [Spiroplasma eriocheiris]AHF57391.1 hypothetical protein SPE_0260 [Spiroplasma eriocheiris CCTCC M 207170]AKM53847.1 hypothetical protein SERIO_v1c02630 [Spiroplasma eriocheiris]
MNPMGMNNNLFYCSPNCQGHFNVGANYEYYHQYPVPGHYQYPQYLQPQPYSPLVPFQQSTIIPPFWGSIALNNFTGYQPNQYQQFAQYPNMLPPHNISVNNERMYAPVPEPYQPKMKSYNAKDEYDWAVHISEILDEFVNRNRPKNRFNTEHDSYDKLITTLNNSINNLNNAVKHNEELIKAANLSEPLPSINSLPTDDVMKEQALAAEVSSVPTTSENLTDAVIPLVTPKIMETPLENEDDHLFFDPSVIDDLDDHEFANIPDDELKEDIQEFTKIEEMPEVEILDNKHSYQQSYNDEDYYQENTNLNDDLVGILESAHTEESVENTIPLATTYKNISLKTPTGKVSAQEVYEYMFDEYGHNKVGQFDVMEKFGLTDKQYIKLLNNFYDIDGPTQKIKQPKLNQPRKINKKALLISLAVILTLVVLVAILIVLYFEVPVVHDKLQIAIDKINSGWNQMIMSIKNKL